MEDFYSTLQVRPTASMAEIERAYRRLVRANHPDLLRDVRPEVRSRAEERLKRINLAHSVLADHGRRHRYDRERARLSARPATRSTAPPGAMPPVVERTSHWTSDGPIDLDWPTAPLRDRQRGSELFTTRRLVLYAVAIVIFVIVLTLLYHPVGTALATPTVTVTPVPGH